MNLNFDDQLAIDATSAIQNGDIEALTALLAANSELAAARIVDKSGVSRTLLHVAADWPGHFPNGAQIVAMLVDAGADVDAAVENVDYHQETALHWAASSNDIAVLDALLDGGANIEMPGAVFTGGPAMSDAVVFGQWRAARRLLERGAQTTVWQAAALGLLDSVRTFVSADTPPSNDALTNALWHACRGGQLATAKLLVARGANAGWIGYDHKTPLDCARESGNTELVQWLEDGGTMP